MARKSERLTDLQVRNAKPRKQPYPDGDGLYLSVRSPSSKSWLFRYKPRGAKKDRWLGLGSYKAFGLAEARARARKQRQLLADGLDPLEVKKASRAHQALEAAKGITFKQAAREYIAARQAGWKSPKHAAQWEATLARYAYPVIGEVSVQGVDTALILRVLEPIWVERSETAARVRGRIERILNAAKAKGLRTGDNPASWDGHLDHLLPHKTEMRAVRHHPALPFTDIPVFMANLRKRDSVSARALEFAALSAARTGAVIGSVWSEFDLTAKVWAVPPERLGAKIVGEDPKPRRVPLSDRAIEILGQLPRETGNPHVFVGGAPGGSLSSAAMAELMKGMAYPSTTPGRLAVPHGLRSTFKDWVSERTNYPNEVSEAALWHAVADKVEAAYRRGDLFDKRCRLMDLWAAYCAGGADQSDADADNVVALRSA